MARRRRSTGSSTATTVQAPSVGFFSAKAATVAGGPNEPMMLVSLVRKPGVLEHVAFSQADAVRLIGAVAHGLANQNLFLGHAVLHVTARSRMEGNSDELPVHATVPTGDKRTLIVRPRPRATRVSDKLIPGRTELEAAHERAAQAGPSGALQQMFDVEPSLALYIDSTLGLIFDRLRHAKCPTNVVQSVENDVILLLATVFTTMRDAHYQLWRDTMMGTRLAQIDPQLETDELRRKARTDSAGEDDAT